MATSRILLPIPGGVAPDGSGTGNNPATPEKVVSSGTQTTNTPKLSYVRLLFDASTDEHWIWNFQLPTDWVSGGTLRLVWSSKGTTNNVVWKGGVKSITPSSDDADAAIYVAGDLGTATAVPGTVGQNKETTITLTTTGFAAGEWLSVFVGRDADHASDTSTSDACLEALTLEYTS